MAKLTPAGGQYFIEGMDSGSNPEYITDLQYYEAENVVCRGGVIQTRPGFRTVFGLPPGHIQGMTIFRPTGSIEHLVIAVDGKVYVSKGPKFEEYYQLPNIRFYERSRFVTFASCVQTFRYEDDTAILQPLARPRNILVMQDGFSPAAYWDGGDNRHLNPVQSNDSELDTLPGFDETPMGLWMSWAGNRLWVGRGQLLYASDLGNPLKFTESQYIAEGRAFYMPEEVTGMVQPSTESPLFVFGENTITRLRADILDRTQWLDTPDFQKEDTQIGCVAGKSIVKTFGLTWWYSKYGVVNYNTALQSFNDSRFQYIDNQMSISKSKMSPRRSGICAAAYENFLLMSVPAGDKWNAHTWCLDQLPAPQSNAAWASWWSGIRPVEWAGGLVNQEPRLFCVSVDYDGVNRVWEAFTGDRTDNGCAIECYVKTKFHNFGSADRKRYDYTELFLDEIVGDVDIAAWYAGRKQGFVKILDKRIRADEGLFTSEDTPEVELDTPLHWYKPQGRTIKTESAERVEDTCNVCGIESEHPQYIDTSFCNLIMWSGHMALRGLRMFADSDTGDDDYRGDCEEDEETFRAITEEGCGTVSDSGIGVGTPFPRYDESATITLSCPTDQCGGPFIGAATGDSLITSTAAEKEAACKAFIDAKLQYDCIDPFTNTAQTATVSCPPGSFGSDQSATVAAGEYESCVSQAEADAEALAAAQVAATAKLNCTATSDIFFLNGSGSPVYEAFLADYETDTNARITSEGTGVAPSVNGGCYDDNTGLYYFANSDANAHVYSTDKNGNTVELWQYLPVIDPPPYRLLIDDTARLYTADNTKCVRQNGFAGTDRIYNITAVSMHEVMSDTMIVTGQANAKLYSLDISGALPKAVGDLVEIGDVNTLFGYSWGSSVKATYCADDGFYYIAAVESGFPTKYHLLKFTTTPGSIQYVGEISGTVEAVDYSANTKYLFGYRSSSNITQASAGDVIVIDPSDASTIKTLSTFATVPMIGTALGAV